MTSSKEQLVPVEQIDREAADELAEALLAGLSNYEIAQFLARHRLAALRTPPAVEPDEGLVERAAQHVFDNSRKGTASINEYQRRSDDAKMMEAYRDIITKALSILTPSIRAQALEEAESVFKEEKNAQAERLGLIPDKMESPVRYYERVRRTAIRALGETQP